MATKPMTGDETRNLLAHLLAGAAGGEERQWRTLVGPVERLATWKVVTHNWQVRAGGTTEQKDAIGRAVDVVRAEHPYIV